MLLLFLHMVPHDRQVTLLLFMSIPKEMAVAFCLATLNLKIDNLLKFLLLFSYNRSL